MALSFPVGVACSPQPQLQRNRCLRGAASMEKWFSNSWQCSARRRTFACTRCSSCIEFFRTRGAPSMPGRAFRRWTTCIQRTYVCIYDTLRSASALSSTGSEIPNIPIGITPVERIFVVQENGELQRLLGALCPLKNLFGPIPSIKHFHHRQRKKFHQPHRRTNALQATLTFA